MRRVAGALVAAVLAGIVNIVAGTAQPQATYLVELDAVVTDGNGKPVQGSAAGLRSKTTGRAEDVRRGGETPDYRVMRRSLLSTQRRRSGQHAGDSDDRARSSRAWRRLDEFSVVRLSNRAMRFRRSARSAAADFRIPIRLPFFGRETVENALRAFAKVSRTLEPIERAKAIVRIGVPDVCGISEPSTARASSGGSGRHRRGWAARTRACIRSSRTATRRLNATGSIADATGGEGVREHPELN
jgi:hypothetical protein